MSNVEGIREHYRNLALDWADAHGDAREANRIFKAHHALFRQIRNDGGGREVISSLLQDENEAVRVLAATHALTFDPGAGEAALEELSHAGGRFALDAKYTLRSFRNGTLDLDW